jgi:hypothetical protein
MAAAVARCRLDLNGAVVVTEAASKAYVVTPVLAALAGAKEVYALSRTTRHGTAEAVCDETIRLANMAGVADLIRFPPCRTRGVFRQADIVTNSGHVRPIDAKIVSWLKPGAVIPLMYEAWELRPEDVDVAACRKRGIPLAGTNERHPGICVFDFLGVMAVKLLLDAGVSVHGNRILLLCDNDFGPYIRRGLTGCGADVVCRSSLRAAVDTGSYECVLVALHPRPGNALGANAARMIVRHWPGAVVAQFWGDLDRPAFQLAEVPVWPRDAPLPGHMGIIPSEVGPEPIVRLQVGGLKVGQLLWNAHRAGKSAVETVSIAERSGYGQGLRPSRGKSV